MKPQNEYLTKAEVAKLLRVKIRTIDSWMAKGVLGYFRIGGRLIRFRKTDIDRHLDENYRIEAD